jgi:hypothetical protein
MEPLATTDETTWQNIPEDWIPPVLLCLCMCSKKLSFFNYLPDSLPFHRIFMMGTTRERSIIILNIHGYNLPLFTNCRALLRLSSPKH